tara:strand:+ start:6748 stop:10206 length:3459 start_codon:yes stop_codon:yes gene_type:complete
MIRHEPDFSTDRNEILRVIRQVRNRWRLRIAFRGTSVLIAAALGTFLASSFGLEVFKFEPTAVVVFRVLTYAVLIGLGWWFFVRPLLRKVSDEQVALYLEEHEPSLQTALLSAVEESKKNSEIRRPDYSPQIVDQLIQSAVSSVREVDMGRAVERRPLQFNSGLLGVVGAVTVLMLLFGPDYLRHGVTALLTPMGNIQAASPYRIDVVPGDVTVARGIDQSIEAKLVGFASDDVILFMRSNESAPFERLPLVPIDESDVYEVLLFDVQASTDYFVSAEGVESSTYTLDVVDLPYVEQLQLQYEFPDYTGLEPKFVDEGGDIAVLRGTTVQMRVITTLLTDGGELVIDEETRTPLVLQEDGTLTGSFIVEEDSFYKIDLKTSDGQLISGSPQYTIDVLTDQPPSVVFINPGRDTTASAIEELFVEARADDDFGLLSLDLLYSVNGENEQIVSLFDGRNSDLREVSAGHTFFLEELNLEPGDFVSYYARATDRNLAQEQKDIKSDLYFVQIRAFGKDFKAAQSQGGMGGGGGADADPRALSEAQRQIVSGTFNVIRDRENYSDDEYRENLVFLTLAQGRLREQVETLLRRMNSRVMPADPEFAAIVKLLPQAAEAMQVAEGELQDQDADGALPPEQRALQFLQRAEEAYEEVMVSMGGGGGGGGNSQSQAAEDLADLFELELDKLQNQYETMQRGQQQETDNTVDELMERLRELARRQEREAERQRRQARGQQSAQGGSAGQRALAEEAEEAARRLERLGREMNSPQMMDASRRLQEAADAMRRAAANDDNLGFAEAGAALDRLREVQDRLQAEQTGRLERDIEDALKRANQLAAKEREIEADVNELSELDDQQRADRLRSLMDRKDAMENDVAELERDLDSTSAEFQREERDASRRLTEAANSIRDNKLKEKIRYSKGLVRSRAPETAKAFETEIGNDIADLQEKLGAASDAVGNSEGDKMAQALDQTRDLMRSLETLEHRMAQESEPSGDEEQDGSQTSGQGGQQAEAGRADGRSGKGDTVGESFTADGSGDRRPGVFDPQDVRQWRSEFQERLGEAQDIRRILEGEQFSAEDLDEIIQQMREFDDQRSYQSAEILADLQRLVLEELKRFEYRLRRELDVESQDLYLASSDDVPPGFRELIEEYYRSLSQDN